MWNLMWLIAGALDGGVDNQPDMLDQFMVTKNMATGDAPIKINAATVQVFKCRP